MNIEMQLEEIIEAEFMVDEEDIIHRLGSGVIPRLVKQIEDLKSEVTNLKSKLEDLEYDVNGPDESSKYY